MDNLLKIPDRAGREVLCSGGVFVFPLMGSDRFVRYCRDRGLSVDRPRLQRLERLRLFGPLFRVRTPEIETRPLRIPLRKNDEWFNRGWARDTTIFGYEVPSASDRTQEGYYSAFQLYHLEAVLSTMSLPVQLDRYLEAPDKPTDEGDQWIRGAAQRALPFAAREQRSAVALLCQFISDRYGPKALTDQRSIQMRHSSSSDRWVTLHEESWDWYRVVREWDVHVAERLFVLTSAKLKRAYEGLATSQAHLDPLAAGIS
jgi:hypothetical protein